MGKSKLVPVGAVTNVDILATILGSKVSLFPMNYLGFPLGSRFKDMSMCYILEKKWNAVCLVGSVCIFRREGE
jgi:hypothetical protein